MKDVPQPSDSPYSPGDEVQVYLSRDDPDSTHHGKTGTVVEVLEDDLGEETERELDSLSYRIETEDEVIDVWFRHTDLVPACE